MANKKIVHKPYNKFKGWLRENNLAYRDIAETLGSSIATINAKINGQSDFSLVEIVTLIDVYDMDSSIFL